MEKDPIIELLRAERLRRGLSQRDLAALVRTTQSTISHVERGDHGVHLSTARRWCAALGFDLVALSRPDAEEVSDAS